MFKIKAIKYSKIFLRNTLLFGLVWELFIFFKFPKSAWEDGLIQSYLMSKGLIIYRDITDQYFPILYLLIAQYHKIVGFTQIATIILAPINSIGNLLILAFISNKWLKSWFKLIPILFFLFWEPILTENHFGTPPFQMTVNLLSFAFWYSWYKKPKKLKAFLLGLFLSLGFLSLQIVIFYVAITFISVLFKAFKDKAYKDSVVALFVSFFIPVIYVAWYFISKNAFGDLIYWNIGFYLHSYPFSALGVDLINYLSYLAVFIPAVFLLGIFYFIFIKKTNYLKLMNLSFDHFVFLFLIYLSLPISFLFAIFTPTRFLLALPISCFIAGLSLQLLLQKRIDKFKIILILLAVGLNLVAFIIYQLPRYQSDFQSRAHPIISEVYPDDPVYGAILWAKQNTKPSDKFFILDDAIFLVDANRLPNNSRAIMAQPWAFEPLEDFKQELVKNPPDYWEIDERLINKRFHQWGYDNQVIFFNKMLNCLPVVYRSDYIVIRKNVPGQPLCF